jgi:hypothetical protein
MGIRRQPWTAVGGDSTRSRKEAGERQEDARSRDGWLERSIERARTLLAQRPPLAVEGMTKWMRAGGGEQRAAHKASAI